MVIDQKLWRHNLSRALLKSKVQYPVWDKIERMNIEPTNRCNADCVFCFREEYRSYPKVDISLPYVIDWMEKISMHSTYKRNKLKRINFGVTGEPLLHPYIVELVKHAKKYSEQVRISTNLMLLDEDMSLALLDAGLNKICFSIDECEKERFEALRRNENFDTVYNNAINFKRIRDEGNFNCDILLPPVLCKENKDRVEIIRKFWKKALNVEAQFSKEIPIGSIVDRVQPWFDPDDIPQCNSMVAIKSNGAICTCCFDVFNKYPVGSIYFSRSFKEILDSDILKNFKRNLMNLFEIPDHCKLCPALPQVTIIKSVQNWDMV